MPTWPEIRDSVGDCPLGHQLWLSTGRHADQGIGEITVTVTTKTGGPKRDRLWDVRVNNPDGSYDVLVGGLTITP